MTVSVIIPTLNAASTIRELLAALKSQEISPKEIIVIDSSSDDHTVKLARECSAKVIEISRDSFDHGRTRNMAATLAKGDILVFMTQDAMPYNRSLISNLISPLSQPDIAASYARQIPRDNATALEIFARSFNYPAKSYVKGFNDIRRFGIKTFFCSNTCSAFKKDIFMKVGKFPEGIPSNEDMLIAARIITKGYRIAYEARAIVLHSHCYSLPQLFRRYYNIGASLRRNKWVLRYSGNAEAEGLRFLLQQTRFVIKNYGLRWLPRIFLEASIKFTGYRMGLIKG